MDTTPEAGGNGTGCVIVRLAPGMPRRLGTSLPKIVKELGLSALGATLDDYDIDSCQRVPHGFPPGRLLELERRALDSPLPPLRSLTRYWRLDCRHRSTEMGEILARLSRAPELDAAYCEAGADDPAVDPSDDPYAALQHHLDPAPVGIDARWAFQQGATGDDVGFCDLEQAWIEEHEDFRIPKRKLVRLVHGANAARELAVIEDGVPVFPPSGDHGAASVGLAVAEDNDLGIVGVAPHGGQRRNATISQIFLSSHFMADSKRNGFVAEAILGAIDDGRAPVLRAGDVLLLEVQTVPARLPVETQDAVFDAIRLASALGIIVVEAAGNGSANLDRLIDLGEVLGEQRVVAFAFQLPAFRGPDSGAIMVGAGLSEVGPDGGHDRAEFSNHGSRVDCYCWGENVVTCGYGDLDKGDPEQPPPPPNDPDPPPSPTAAPDPNVEEGEPDIVLDRNPARSYTQSFGGTSAASAIIAGAALAIQSRYQATAGGRLTPLQMRSLIANPATGTPQGDGVAGNIGVMPDLRAILSESLGVVPDVYIRDSLADDGTVPTGDISRSPDVIVTREPLRDPNASLGEGSGTEDSFSLTRVELGQDNFIYLRMKNRGAGLARGVRARVYWSPLLSLIQPEDWRFIGRTDPVDVPAGDCLVVAGPLKFSATDPDLTPAGNGFLVVLDHPNDPGPALPSGFEAFWNFYSFVKNNNNVTWLGFRTVDELPDPGGIGHLPDFVVAGALDRARRFSFRVEQRLPDGAELWLEAPPSLVRRLRPSGDLEVEMDEKTGLARLRLPRLCEQELCEVMLRPGEKHRARFAIGGTVFFCGGNRVVLKQILDGEEVGRLAWNLAPSRRET